MDVLESALGHGTSSIGLFLCIVVLLNSDLVTANLCNPSDVAARTGVCLGNRAWLRGIVDGYAACPGRLVPGIGVAPVVALVVVGELDAEALVDAVGNEAGALALEECPWVSAAAFARVRVVILDWARDGASLKLVGFRFNLGFDLGFNGGNRQSWGSSKKEDSSQRELHIGGFDGMMT